MLASPATWQFVVDAPAGYAYFGDSGQGLDNAWSRGVSLGDVDGDGDIDAFVANNGANTVWLNDGGGTFADSGQLLGDSDSYDISLGDIDGDYDMDAFVANGGFNRVWLNNGSGTFTDTGIVISTKPHDGFNSR